VIGEIAGTAVLNGRDVLLHHHEAGTGKFLRQSAPGGMVVVSVADEDDLDIRELPAQLGDAPLNQRDRFGIIGIDEDVALRSGDEIRREIVGSDVVEIAGDAKGWRRLIPLRGKLRAYYLRNEKGIEESNEEGKRATHSLQDTASRRSGAPIGV
jgi:hypothetical protein